MAQEELDYGALAVLNKLFKNEDEDDVILEDDNPGQENFLPTSARGVEVSCGNVNGVLLLDLFSCPGINQPCLMISGGLHTPKELAVMAGKDKQKDWKGSIRIAGQSMRNMMDTGRIDFAQHDINCSGKCNRSRAAELASSLQFLNKLPPSGFPTNGFLPAVPPGTVIPTPSPQLNLAHVEHDFIPADVTQQHLQKIMVKEPMRFFTELHQMRVLPQILNDLANALKSTSDEEPLPTNFSLTFAPALFCALNTFNLLPEVFEMVKQKKKLQSQAVQLGITATDAPQDIPDSQNFIVKDETS